MLSTAILVVAACDARVESAKGTRPAEVGGPETTTLPLGQAAPMLPDSRPVVVTVTGDRRIEVGEHVWSHLRKDRDALRADLATLARTTPEEDRALLVRADASTLYGVIQSLLDASSSIEIRHWYLEVAPDAAGGRHAFEAQLPGWFGAVEWQRDVSEGSQPDGGPCPLVSSEPPRVCLWWDSATKKVERLFGEAALMSGTAGDDLEATLRAFGQQLEARGATLPAVIVECSALVTWQQVIDVAELAARAGWPMIELSSGLELDEVQPWGAETR